MFLYIGRHNICKTTDNISSLFKTNLTTTIKLIMLESSKPACRVSHAVTTHDVSLFNIIRKRHT